MATTAASQEIFEPDPTGLGALVDDLTGRPSFECADHPVIEWPKFQGCYIPYIDALDDYLDAREQSRKDRLEATRSRPWEWFAAAPIVSCDSVPTLETQKFTFWCQGDSADALGNLRNQLVGLKVRRESLARQVERLKKQHAELAALPDFGPEPTFSGDLSALNASLGVLDGKLAQFEVMERAAVFLSEQSDVTDISGLRMAQLRQGSDLRDGADALATSFATVASADNFVIQIETGAGQSEITPVIHPIYGLAYVARSEIVTN